MGHTSRKRRTTKAQRAVAAAAALVMGAGGLVVANVYASASGTVPRDGGELRQQVATIDCPDVGNELTDVPAGARAGVDGELAALDSQITESYRRLADSRDDASRDPGFVRDSILTPLGNDRAAALERIQARIRGNGGTPPRRFDSLAACTGRTSAGDRTTADGDDEGEGGDRERDGGRPGGGQNGGGDGGQGGSDGGGRGGGGQGGGNGQAGNGPVAADFADIRSVRPNVQVPRSGRDASRGTFSTSCGTNRNRLFNPDNVIVAPGVSNGAHHMHDYVGNQANNAFADDRTLAAGRTTCRNQGDRSSYFWPVLRVQNGRAEADADADGGGRDRNVGRIRTPSEVTLRFEGNPRSRVVAMPRFLRIITGDAKALTNGTANANASWSCTGFENRQLRDKYPLCPQGSQVVRTFRFQSCWDGRNTDSANHRTHVAFADPRSGACPSGFKAIPQLVQRVVYDVPPRRNFAVDSFPEQLHKPVTDHGDFINVFDSRLMNRLTDCVNRGRRCS
ncbi:DUF1996 domain-containing protein [Streptomyces uncialis]|uniref:DUF1996 domain-containing protein n=1 Tax=Streptomyces uncialis TaxID=1048205 RepID=UPI0033E3B931